MYIRMFGFLLRLNMRFGLYFWIRTWIFCVLGRCFDREWSIRQSHRSHRPFRGWQEVRNPAEHLWFTPTDLHIRHLQPGKSWLHDQLNACPIHSLPALSKVIRTLRLSSIYEGLVDGETTVCPRRWITFPVVVLQRGPSEHHLSFVKLGWGGEGIRWLDSTCVVILPSTVSINCLR